jgi:hypothetical protein
MKNLMYLFAFVLLFCSFGSCKKTTNPGTSANPANTNTYSSETELKWIDMQLQLIRTSSPFVGIFPPQRFYAYTSIALYESVVNGMPEYQSLSGQLTNMPVMPQPVANQSYNWAAAANASLAAMTRFYYPTASASNLAAVDSLEKAMNVSYRSASDTATINRSAAYGKAVAQLIFDWSKTDGAVNANAAYVPPVGPGLWVPTPPAKAAAFGPYWGNNRLLFPGSLANSTPPPPPAYSTDPASDYYKTVKEVYDVSLALTPDQTATAVYYRDNPGYGGAHYLSMLKQILQQENRKLDFSAYAYAKASIAIVDAAIGCFKIKYQYNQERPITFIRNILGHTAWNGAIVTPNFPDYPSAHSVIGGAFTEVMKNILNTNQYSITDHSYDYLGMAPRSFTSFDDMVTEIAMSRLYGGIHNRISCEKGIQMGKTIGQNVNTSLHFLK